MRLNTRLAGSATTLLCALFAVACSPPLVTTSSGPALGGASPTTGGDPCSTCVNAARTGGCAAEVTSCGGDAKCGQLGACLLDCQPDDSTCRSHCVAAVPKAAASELGAIGLCLCHVCSAQCAKQCGAAPVVDGGAPKDGAPAPASDGGGAPGGDPDSQDGGIVTPPANGGDCDSCSNTAKTGSCAGPSANCSGDPDCANLAGCLDGCAPNDANCQQQCVGGYSQSTLDLLDAVDQCLCATCAAPCASECQ